MLKYNNSCLYNETRLSTESSFMENSMEIQEISENLVTPKMLTFC